MNKIHHLDIATTDKASAKAAANNEAIYALWREQKRLELIMRDVFDNTEELFTLAALSEFSGCFEDVEILSPEQDKFEQEQLRAHMKESA